jgi:tetratricopeptide (TPR) repeat protein
MMLHYQVGRAESDLAPRIISSILTFLMVISTGPVPAKGAELSPAKGIERYEKLVKLHPRKASYQNALGYYYLKAERYEEAEKSFLKAIEMDDAYAIPHNNLGILYLRQRRAEKAEKEFRQALKLNSRYTKAQYNLAVALFHQKRYGEAAKAYLKARELDSAYVDRRDWQENRKEKVKQALEQAAEDDKSNEKLKRMKQWFAPYY